MKNKIYSNKIVNKTRLINKNNFNKRVYDLLSNSCSQFEDELELLGKVNEELPAHISSQINDVVNVKMQINSDNDVTNNNDLKSDFDINRISVENSAKSEFGTINSSPSGEAKIKTRYPSGCVAHDLARVIDNPTIVSTTKSLGVQVPTSSVTEFSLQLIINEVVNNKIEIASDYEMGNSLSRLIQKNLINPELCEVNLK